MNPAGSDAIPSHKTPLNVAADPPEAMWQHLLAGAAPNSVQNLLPAYLLRQRWFGAKSRIISAVRILDWVQLPLGPAVAPSPPVASGGDEAIILSTGGVLAAGVEEPAVPTAAIVFIEVTYAGASAESKPDVYQLPLALTAGPEADAVRVNAPASILTSLDTPSGPAILHDATAREDVRQSLLALIATGTRLFATIPRTLQSEAVILSGGGPAAGVEGPAVAPASDASLAGQASAAFAATRGTGPLPARTGSAEQSNTSILYGNKLILKLFRRLQPGENPDAEIGRFLTEVAHFPRIPPFLGQIVGQPISREGNTNSAAIHAQNASTHSNQGSRALARPEPHEVPSNPPQQTTLAMLQGLVENEGDGWQHTLDELARYYEVAVTLPMPIDTGDPPSFLDDPVPPPIPADVRMRAGLSDARENASYPAEVREHAGLSLAAAALLGRRTAQLHLALATPTDNPVFASNFVPEPFTAEALAADTRRIRAQIAHTLEALKQAFSNLTGELTIDSAALILSRRVELFSRAFALTEIQPAEAGQRIRIHGDYHLGQVLRTRGDYVILDFEGEPARPLAERRAKQSPLKDVAGMLRSFSYVAYAALDRFANSTRNQRSPAGTAARLEPWAQLWQNAAAAEFLTAWRNTIAANPLLTPAPIQADRMLNAYLLEKALYELLYELNNRPTWVRIPLAGILALLPAGVP